MAQIQVLFEDDDLIALNKPSGLLTIPDRFDPTLPSLKTILREQYDDLFIIHRIDRDTSGLILFAKNATAHKYYSQLFESRSVEKKYYALVHGRMSSSSGTFDQPIGEHFQVKGKMAVSRKGKTAITHFNVVETFQSYSWLQLNIETGRTHQIRVHLQDAGHPVVCDPLYGTNTPLLLSTIKKKKFKLSKDAEEEQPLMNRLALHAYSLEFQNQQGQKSLIEAPLFKDMQATLKQLEKWTGVNKPKA
ncbi:RluA family pseudouridine synthase [Pollutibacter soli]|uniref:RluA family pseudouridine synthase n=1 Tax=Pollutibacter soli TaxID=3034157 RepID=UPI0030132488